MQEAVRTMAKSGVINSGERIVAISGSPQAMRGATGTVRLYRLEPDGSISGTSERSTSTGKRFNSGLPAQVAWVSQDKVIDFDCRSDFPIAKRSSIRTDNNQRSP